MKNRARGKKQPARSQFPFSLPQGAGRRILLGLITAGCVFIAAWARILPQKLDYVEGDRADRTIRAPRSGTYVDPEEMQRLREDAAEAVPEIYDPIPGATEKALTALDDIFSRFRDVRSNPALADPLAKVTELRNSLDISLSDETLALAVRETTSDAALARVQDGLANLIRREMAGEIRDNATDLEQARQRIAEAVGGLRLTSPFTAMAREIGQAVIVPNRILDRDATEEARKQKRDSVADVVHPIQPRDIIILAGEEVRPRHIAAFQAVGLMQETIDYTRALGVLAVATIMVFLLGLFIRRFNWRVWDNFDQLVTVAALLVATTFAFRALGTTTWFEAGSLTVAIIFSSIVALLMGVSVGMAVGVFSGLLLPILASGGDIRMVMVLILCTTVSVFLVSRTGRKSGVIALAAPMMAAWAALVMLICSEVFSITVTPRLLGIAAVGGLVSPLLAMGASVALERLLGVTTEFRLIELANPHEPLLQRLIREAPGTYQSSLMAANLAEPAAEAIGANALLVRVAAMYHDIGKLKRPYMFVENQPGSDNPHDRLSPHLSALIITNHVREGVELAREYGLPQEITAFITEHHGTTLVEYFYRRARDQADDPDAIPEISFRYPGPKPQSRETALFMLADTVEAAARTLDDPSRYEIEEMVERLVKHKIEDGQLDEAPLSFRDLTTIKRSFVNTIASMYHHRVKYPEQIIREHEGAHPAGKPNSRPRESAVSGRSQP